MKMLSLVQKMKDHKGAEESIVLKRIKARYEYLKKQPKYVPEKIKTRNFELVERPASDNDWLENAKRRKEQLKCGFFCDNGKRYLHLGEPELNTDRLIDKNFEALMPPGIDHGARLMKKCLKLGANKLVKPVESSDDTDNDSDLNQGKENKILDCTDAGYKQIKYMIGESNKRVASVKAGATYDPNACNILPSAFSHDSKCQDESEMEMQMRALSPSEFPVFYTDERDGLTLYRELTGKKDSNVMGGFTGILTMRGKARMKANKRRARERQYLLVKMRNILLILTSVMNIRQRDLKSRFPLTSKTLQQLLSNSVKYIEDPAHDPNAIGVRNEPSFHRNLPSDKASHAATNASKTYAPAHSTIATNKKLAFTSRLLASKQNRDERPKLENWDDLLNSQIKIPSRTNDNNSRGAASGDHGGLKPTSRFRKTSMALRAMTKLRPLGGVSKDTDQPAEPIIVVDKKPPVWLMVEQQEKMIMNRKKSDNSSTEETGEQLERANPDIFLETIRADFDASKTQLAEVAQAKLLRIESLRELTFRHKYSAFEKLEPLFEKHKHRVIDKSYTLDIYTNDSTSDYPDWFIDLKRECELKAMGTTDKEINSLISKLGRFVTQEKNNMNDVKAKMCLLISSLPAKRLLTFDQQNAFRCVTRDILKAPVELFNSWLDLRGIPIVK
ncbi:unnamed protein product [Owenia fusiformis]|uniref:Uncharacterized protein n=1 Tax=Owenia fusiformis TaxID=6347 RepID=A0A8J1Y252_OWEFU|nr:unnamed protein product [Owenia fusiformis]